MNLFNIADANKAIADTKKRGNQVALKGTISVPFFKGLYRKGEKYSIKVAPIKGRKKVDVEVKPLTGAFIISYATCLAQCIVDAENSVRLHSNEIEQCLEPVVLTSYLVEVVLQSEGFTSDDYKQGKTTGARRIEQHLKAVAEQRELPITVTDSVIEGVNSEIVNSVLQAV